MNILFIHKGATPILALALAASAFLTACSNQAPPAPDVQLVVGERDSWIESFEKLPDDAVAQSPASESARRTRISGLIPALETGDLMPNFRLTDQNDESFHLQRYQGRHVVLTFIFSRCPAPSFCPLMSDHFKALRDRLDSSPLGERVQLLSITLDPEFDTPENLRIYAKRYEAEEKQWTFATGSRDEIDELTSRFSLYVESEDGTITHSLVTAWITPDGRLAQVWRGNHWTPEEIFEAISGSQL